MSFALGLPEIHGTQMAEALERDRFRLEDIGSTHAIGADIFVPFVVTRLGGETSATEASLVVELRDVRQVGNRLRQLDLYWAAATVPAKPPGVPQRHITEWAACGIACVVAHVYGGLQISSITGDGDRFDYWVTEGRYHFGLEVSGTLSEDLAARHRAKARQLLANPFGVDGYVAAVDFAARRAIFSFHRYQESRK